MLKNGHKVTVHTGYQWSNMRTNLKTNQIGMGRVLVIAILIVVIFGSIILVSQIQPSNASPIKIQKFEVQPSEFSVRDTGALVVKLENVVSSGSINVLIHFETSGNVQIYQGNNILPKESGHYVYNKQLSASEVTELRFNLKGTIDVGDNSRDYYVKAFCYVDNTCYSTPTASFRITRS